MSDEDALRAKSILDGKLMFISPSLLGKFDKDAKYGCERAGWFEYVQGKKSPPNYKMTRGTFVASMQEHYLKSGGKTLLMGTDDQSKWFKKLIPHLDKHIASGRVMGAELAMPEGFAVGGVPVHPNSKADIVLSGPAEIEDLKTTGDINKNGKTEHQLAKDTQLVLYAEAFFPDAPEIKLTHSYLQLEGNVFHKPRSVLVSRSAIDKTLSTTIIPLVERVKSLVGVKDVRTIERAQQSKCFNCAHRSYCPPTKENPLMNIFDQMRQKLGQPAATPAAANTSAAPVVPPDAPKSDPAQAAKPVENFQALPPAKTEKEKAERRMPMTDVDSAGNKVEFNQTRPEGLEDDEWKEMLEKRRKKAIAAAEEKIAAAKKAADEQAKKDAENSAAGESDEKKNKGGRPPGAKNKPKLDGEEQTEVSYGLTVNLGDFNSVRIDVRRSKRHSAEQAEEVYGQLLDEVKASVEKEMQKVMEGAAAAAQKK